MRTRIQYGTSVAYPLSSLSCHVSICPNHQTGRTTPFVGLNFSWNTLRECDMVTVGCTSPEEAEEDIEISLAALERRRPNLERRASLNINQDVFK